MEPITWQCLFGIEVNRQLSVDTLEYPLSFLRINLSFANLDSDEDIRLRKSDCEESEKSAEITDNIPVNPDIYITRDGTEWIPHSSIVSGRFMTRNVFCDKTEVQQALN
ncbi:hypothetical protein TNCV_3488481 [Trichonephila clavipes]|nr:hypothetical protein TNCV_3488481 [Trichonephila clavipes]